jgi:hypothetical protein
MVPSICNKLKGSPNKYLAWKRVATGPILVTMAKSLDPILFMPVFSRKEGITVAKRASPMI